MTRGAVHGPTDYRAGVGIVLANNQGMVFAGKRRDDREYPWQMPQGGLIPGEAPGKAALREVFEELGIQRITVIDRHPDWLRYDYPGPATSRRAAMFRGQQHLWFLARFDGDDNDIRIDTAHAEFRQWQWMEPDRLAALVVPFKRQVYREVFAFFRPTLQRLEQGLPIVARAAVDHPWPPHNRTAAPVTLP